jgi:hypothetical protein
VAELWADIVREVVKGADVILGILIGGTISTLATYLTDRRRLKREDKYRDYAERRQVYADFISSWFEYEGLLNRPTAGRNPIEDLTERDEAHSHLLKRCNTLSLIAPDEVREAVVRVKDGEPDAPGHFWKATRKDLGKLPS